MNPVLSIQDIAALTVIASFVGGILLWAGSRLFATRTDLHLLRADLQKNTMETGLIGRDVSWIKAKLTDAGAPR